MTQNAAPVVKTPPSGNKWRARLVKLTLLSISSLVSLCLLEVGIRILFPYYNPKNQIIIQTNPDGVVLGVPNTKSVQGTPKGDFIMTVAFNRHGLRDTKDFLEAGQDDLFVVGDSFSIGWGVEESQRYSNLLQAQLNRPVYNLAIPEDIRGYIRTVDYVQKRGARIRHLLVGLCMENDLWDYTLPVSTHVLYGQQMRRTLRHRVAYWFKRRSALWTCLSHLLQKYDSIRQVFEKAGIAKNVDQLTHKNEASPKILAATRDELLKLTTNYHSLILIIPSRALWYGKNVETERKTHQDLVTMLEQAGAEVVDVKPVFEQTGDPLSCYFKSDPHWNPKGHALATKTVMEYLERAPDWQFLKAPAPAVKTNP